MMKACRAIASERWGIVPDRDAARFRIEDLSVDYGAMPALRNLTMDITDRRITALVGPSGCGKSTLLSCLNRMTDLVAGCRVRGRILLAGQDIHAEGVDLINLRRRVGMIFQRPNPFPLSIKANIAYPLSHHGLREPRALREAVEAALKAVGLWNEVKDRLDAPALGLSGGQQQRLCIARALALEPEVILLDEPCSALDPIASGVVEDLIASMRGRYTVAIVTHNIAQAKRIADDLAIFWIVDGVGRLIERGPAARVLEKPSHEISAMYIAGVRG
jgi:phosphate transport system ATP-binding protein